MTDISDMRTSFEKNEAIDINTFEKDPIAQFNHWFNQACADTALVEPNAFVLSTVNADLVPTTRTVLLKYYDQDGFVFFTNYNIRKAKAIEQHSNVSMLFPWYVQQRQLIIEGQASVITRAESLRYFMTRPRGSQIGAWVSHQSQVISSRALLKQKAKELANQFLNKEVDLPSFWGGYRIKPARFEFWQGQPDRLHDRIEYTKEDEDWIKKRLSP